MEADPRTETEVLQVFSRVVEAVSSRDVDGTVALFASDPSVIFASRITEEASGGESLASTLLRELTESAGDIRFDQGREVILKGLTGAHHVYPVQLV